MFRKKVVLLGFFLWLLSPTFVCAQSEVDAVRLGALGSGIGARAIGMGSAFTAVSDDYSALFFNPAGLGQIKRSELQVGFDFNSYTSDAAYLGEAKSGDNTVTAVNSIGAVLPVPTYQGSFAVAFGYNRLSNFTAAQNVSAFNSSGTINNYFSSFSPVLNQDDQVLLTDPGALAYDTYLLDLNQAGNAYINSQIDHANVRQLSELMEDGGMNAFSAAASIEVAPKVFAGLALNIYSGEYTYSRTYREIDEKNEYPVFRELSLQDDITTDISGWGLKLGMLYRMDENFRFGLTVELPKFLTLKDSYKTTLQAFYDQPPAGATKTSYESSLDGSFEYSLRTPFLFSFGFSYQNELLLLSADAGFTDWTQLKYDDDKNLLQDANRTIKSELTQALNGAVGVEVHVPGTGLKVRGGYAIEQSPFKYKLKNPAQKTNFDDAKKSLTVGIGAVLQNTVSLDAAYTLTSFTVENRLYGGSDVVKEDVSVGNFILTASFRFQ